MKNQETPQKQQTLTQKVDEHRKSLLEYKTKKQNSLSNSLTAPSKLVAFKHHVKEESMSKDNIKHLNWLTFHRRRWFLYLQLLIFLSPLTVFLSLFFVPIAKDKVTETNNQIKSLLITLKELNDNPYKK